MRLTVQDAAVRDRLAAGMRPQLVEEHRRRPFGPHSPALADVLAFLRRNPAPDLPRYVVLVHADGFAIGIRPDRRDADVPAAGPERFATRAAAEHGVFLRRLADYGLAP
ncbi:MAG TPA: hypothetical protein VFM58_13660 [Solirubrobacteraceae bacterium]|nr:hypothetical protein [Solirubrobacteraceae bacterium]